MDTINMGVVPYTNHARVVSPRCAPCKHAFRIIAPVDGAFVLSRYPVWPPSWVGTPARVKHLHVRLQNAHSCSPVATATQPLITAVSRHQHRDQARELYLEYQTATNL